MLRNVSGTRASDELSIRAVPETNPDTEYQFEGTRLILAMLRCTCSSESPKGQYTLMLSFLRDRSFVRYRIGRRALHDPSPRS